MPKKPHHRTHKLCKEPNKLRDGIVEYIESCRAASKVPHIVGLAVHLDVHRQRFAEWIETYSKEEWIGTPQEDIPALLKKARQACECGLVDQVVNGNKPVGSMFILKTHHSYIETEKVKHEHSGGISVSVASNIPGPLATTTKDT